MHESYYFQQGLRDIVTMLEAYCDERGLSLDTYKLVITVDEPSFEIIDRDLHEPVFAGNDEELIAWLNSPKPE